MAGRKQDADREAPSSPGAQPRCAASASTWRCWRAPRPAPRRLAVLSSAGRQREGYLRRLGISRRGAGSRSGQASPMPQGWPSLVAIETHGLKIESETTVGSGSARIEIADSSDEDEIASREDSCLTVNSGAGAAAPAHNRGLLMRGRSDEEHARWKFLQRLSYERVWIPKAQRPPSHQTVIIFDWDDTLLCSSFLSSRQQMGAPLSEGALQQLRAIEKVGAKLLKMAQCLGQTFIITNAADGWVQTSAKAYAPALAPLLEEVQVISARSRYGERYPYDAWMWKAKVFLEVRRRLNSSVITNLVSLGDSEYEMAAARAMGQEFERAAIKLVKFKERPHPGELLEQLSLVTSKFDRIVGLGRNLRVTCHRRADEFDCHV